MWRGALLRPDFDGVYLGALTEEGSQQGKYRAILIGCKCGIPSECRDNMLLEEDLYIYIQHLIQKTVKRALSLLLPDSIRVLKKGVNILN